MPLYGYYCGHCESTTDKIFSSSERPETVKCESCEQGNAEYHVSSPAYFRVPYEQNGRKAVKIDMGAGKKLYRSATRENYEHKAGNVPTEKYKQMGYKEKRKINESVYTKGYTEHIAKKKGI